MKADRGSRRATTYFAQLQGERQIRPPKPSSLSSCILEKQKKKRPFKRTAYSSVLREACIRLIKK